MSASDSSGDAESAVARRIASGILLGHTAAEEQLYARYRDGLAYLIRRRTGDPDLAEDIVQQTFVVALQRLRSRPLDDPERLAGYLRGIALNSLLGEQRKAARQATDSDSERLEGLSAHTCSQFDAVSSEESARLVRKLIAELDVPRDRELLYRAYVDQQSKHEICQALGMESLQYNRVLHRAKQRFRDLLVEAERRQQLRLVE